MSGESPAAVTLTPKERAWHWRTWNLLLQLERATDGEDPRQKSGEMTGRGLWVHGGPAKRALEARGWIAPNGEVGEAEVADGNLRAVLIYEITPAGRAALAAARTTKLSII